MALFDKNYYDKIGSTAGEGTGPSAGKTWNLIMDNMARFFLGSLISVAAFLPLAVALFFGYILRLPPSF